jgi:hypothetical protein
MASKVNLRASFDEKAWKWTTGDKLVLNVTDIVAKQMQNDDSC